LLGWEGRRAVIVVLAIIAFACPVFAQQGTADLRGRVVDEQAGVLPGVIIVVGHQESGLFRESISGAGRDTYRKTLAGNRVNSVWPRAGGGARVRLLRIVIDYRSALRARTGVGEYVHQLVRAWPARDDELTIFTSSWKDRPCASLAVELSGVQVSDHRLPVSALNFVWHNLEWPPVEWLTRGACDVVFSPHPLLTPAWRAAQVVMVHDLDFLAHPERTVREIRRDYPRLAAAHACRADRVIVPSHYTAREVTRLLRVPPSRVAVCPPGLPEWADEARGFAPNGYWLFVGALEPRKNVMGLLAVYEQLLRRRFPVPPPLVLAGAGGADAERCLAAIARPPLAGHVQHIGYFAGCERQRVYAGARALVLPSLDEGFGMPALEAMSLGVPVIVSARGALPELVGDAGLVFDPADERSFAYALTRLLTDEELARTLSSRGRTRAAHFSWRRTAEAVQQAFTVAMRTRRAAVQTEEAQSFPLSLTSRFTNRRH
jgi:glycosyltransferase involved in cell wall biosynthesis